MKKSIVENTVILFTAAAITKIIGAVLKIPLANLLGGTGMGYFSTAYSIFSPVYALAAAGIPIAVARMTARRTALREYSAARQMKKAAVILSLILGVIGTLLAVALGVLYPYLFDSAESSSLSIIAIAPSVLFCCIAAALRGYYEGLCNMLPTAISQVTEAIVKALAGLLLATAVLQAKTAELGVPELALPYAAAAAVAGISLGELCGTVFLIIRSLTGKGEYPVRAKKEGLTACSGEIFRAALPISLGALAAKIPGIIDLLTIPNLILLSAERDASYLLSHFTYGSGGISLAETGNFLYGCYTGIISSLVMLIPALLSVLGKSFLPRISAAVARECKPELRNNIRLLFLLVFNIGLPLCAFLSVMAEPVMRLLYPGKTAEIEASSLSLTILAGGGIIIAFSAALFTAFQALGRSDIAVKLTLLSAAIKLPLNILLISIPQLNIAGAAISSVSAQLAAAVIGTLILRRISGCSIAEKGDLVPPFLFAAAGCAGSLAAYISTEGTALPLRLLIAVISFAAIYISLMLIFRRKQLISLAGSLGIIKITEM